MKPILVHPEAEEELRSSAEFYESRATGLGARFLDEIEKGYLAISESPLTWPGLSSDIRRYQLKKFPFGLLYLIREDHVFVVAVMHLYRQPDYWKSRL